MTISSSRRCYLRRSKISTKRSWTEKSRPTDTGRLRSFKNFLTPRKPHSLKGLGHIEVDQGLSVEWILAYIDSKIDTRL